MNRKILSGILLLFFCSIGFIGCENDKDDGFRSFMSKATIVSDSTNRYYCYLDGGGLVVSYDRTLAGIERGYFAFSYMEYDWTAANNVMYINNAHVIPHSIYDVIHPIGIEEAEANHIIDKDSCKIPPLFSLSYGYRGFFNINTGLSIVNLTNVETVPVKMNMVYDPVKQNPDTLKLQLCYNLQIPDKWSNTSINYGSASCDISSLATLEQWNDSVTIVIETGDEIEHWTKISKNDFLKPDIKIGYP